MARMQEMDYYGTEYPERCVICGRFLAIDNDTGTCPAPRECGAKLKKIYDDEANGMAAAYQETLAMEATL